MKRYHAEKHIIQNRAKQHRQLNAAFDNWVNSLPPEKKREHVVEDGRYRKTFRCGGCTRARCQICHPEKYPRRIPTRQERQDYRDDE